MMHPVFGCSRNPFQTITRFAASLESASEQIQFTRFGSVEQPVKVDAPLVPRMSDNIAAINTHQTC